MSKISRIRILNLNYNNNTIKIDDETFDLGGQNTLISLRNGGGKSVLVQMIVSLFVNRTYRDFGDRPFKSYFTTNRLGRGSGESDILVELVEYKSIWA